MMTQFLYRLGCWFRLVVAAVARLRGQELRVKVRRLARGLCVRL